MRRAHISAGRWGSLTFALTSVPHTRGGRRDGSRAGTLECRFHSPPGRSGTEARLPQEPGSRSQWLGQQSPRP
jgi:hypothetical protein